jgi:hypothetical protein
MSSISCIIIPAIVGVICGILGYLIGRMAWNGTEGVRGSTLKAELDACRSHSKSLKASVENLESELAAANLSNAAMLAASKAVQKPKPKPKPKAEPKVAPKTKAAGGKK